MSEFLDGIRALFDPPATNGHGKTEGGFWSSFVGAGQGYADTALARECDEVTHAPVGRRNDTLNAAAFSLGQLVAGGALPRARVVMELAAAAARVGLTQHETERTIASGLKAGANSPRTVPPRELILPNGVPVLSGTGLGQVGQVLLDEAAAVWEHLPRLDWHALWTDDTPEEWIIEPLIPARRLVALYSPPKIGKSLLILELAVAIARGTPVVGVTPDRPRRVLYVDFENDPTGDVRERLKAMGHGPDDLENLVYLSFPTLAALDSDRGGAQLMAAVHTYACEVVVVDTVSRAIQGQENENDTWLAFYRHTGKALKAAGVTLVRLDHTGKDENRGQRGGSAKSGDVDMVWRMSKITDTVFQLDCEAHRMRVIEKTIVIHRDTVPRLRHRVDAAGRSAAWRVKVAAAVEALDGLELPKDIGRDKAREALRQVGMQVRNEVLAEAVRRRKTSMGFSPEPVPKIAGQAPLENLSPRSWDGVGTGTSHDE